MKNLARLLIALGLVISLSGCLGLIVGSAVDVGIEVVKVPFKLTKAAVNVMSSDDDKKKKDK